MPRSHAASTSAYASASAMGSNNPPSCAQPRPSFVTARPLFGSLPCSVTLISFDSFSSCFQWKAAGADGLELLVGEDEFLVAQCFRTGALAVRDARDQLDDLGADVLD